MYAFFGMVLGEGGEKEERTPAHKHDTHASAHTEREREMGRERAAGAAARAEERQ
jgi:hypothetical protein